MKLGCRSNLSSMPDQASSASLFSTFPHRDLAHFQISLYKGLLSVLLAWNHWTSALDHTIVSSSTSLLHTSVTLNAKCPFMGF